jgi:hypothetical protein
MIRDGAGKIRREPDRNLSWFCCVMRNGQAGI